MPTLSAGQIATLTITQPNGWVTVSCAIGDEAVTSWVGPGGISGQRTTKNLSEDIGPFTDNTVVTIRSVSGSPQYSDNNSGVRVVTCDTSGSNAASANQSALQAAMTAGGVVRVSGSGRAHCLPVRVPSGCILQLDAGVTLYRADGTNAPLIRNKYGGQKNKATRFNRLNNVVTVNNRHHGMPNGQLVWVGSLTDTTMHGIQTAQVIDAHTWSYASAGSNGAGGAATVFGDIIPLQRTLAGASLVAASNVVTVNDPGHDLRPGMQVWLGTSGASTAFAGVVEVIAVWPDNWQYVTAAAGTGAASGTFGISYDRDIVITGDGTIDGNALNNSTQQDVDIMLSAVVLGMVNQARIDVKRIAGTIFRGVNVFNGTDVKVRDVEFGDTLVGVQFEGGGRRLRVEGCSGGTAKWVSGAQLLDDFVAFTGTKTAGGQLYDSTVSPYGISGFYNCTVVRNHAPNCLNGIKMTGDVSCTFDLMVFEDLTGGMLNNNVTPLGGQTAAVRCVDDTLGLIGMTVGRVFMRRINWFGGASAFVWSTSGIAQLIELDGVNYAPNAQQSAANTNGVAWVQGATNANGVIKTLRIKNFGYVPPSGVFNKPAIVLGNGNVRTTQTITIEELEVDGYDITVGNNTSGAGILKYGNCVVLNARIGKGVFRGPASGTGHAIACNGPNSMGRWVLNQTRVAAGGAAMGLVFSVVNADASDTVAAGEIVLRDCDITSTSGIYDNATNWTGTLTVRVSGSRMTYSGNFLNIAVATGLVAVHADLTAQTTADKVAAAMVGTLRMNAPTFQLDGNKVTAPQPSDQFWNTNATMTGSASIGMKARTNAGAWTALF